MKLKNFVAASLLTMSAVQASATETVSFVGTSDATGAFAACTYVLGCVAGTSTLGMIIEVADGAFDDGTATLGEFESAWLQVDGVGFALPNTTAWTFTLATDGLGNVTAFDFGTDEDPGPHTTLVNGDDIAFGNAGIGGDRCVDAVNGIAQSGGACGGLSGNPWINDIVWTGVPASAVPVPAAAWLFGSALVGLAGIGRKRKNA